MYFIGRQKISLYGIWPFTYAMGMINDALCIVIASILLDLAESVFKICEVPLIRSSLKLIQKFFLILHYWHILLPSCHIPDDCTDFAR